MKESVNSHIERVHFIRQKWAASVIADGLRKNCEIQKKERLKKEQEERERKRKLEEERKRKKEEEERNRKTEEQRGKEKERTVGVRIMFFFQHCRKKRCTNPNTVFSLRMFKKKTTPTDL